MAQTFSTSIDVRDVVTLTVNRIVLVEAAALGEQAREALDRFTVEVRSGQQARVGLSFGVAAYPADGGSIDELLHTAAASARKKKDLRKCEDAHYLSKEHLSKELRLVSRNQPPEAETELLASNQ